MKYAAGLDGGGTKTAVVIVDEKGQELHAFTSGAINFNGQDEASIRCSLQEIMDTIAKECGGLAQCEQICIGAAGISNPTVVPRLTSLVRECGYEGGLVLTGDHETALCGALDGEAGMILIAGTGSICYGRNEAGLTHRTGGCGYLIDDEGSGYSIGRDLISALVRSNDGRLPATVITELVYEQLKLHTVQQLVGFVHAPNTNKKDIAALAPLISEACARGDQAAMAIVEKSASSLYELVVPVVEKLKLQEGTVAMAGSVLLKNDYVRAAFVDKLQLTYPNLKCIPAIKDAANGAALMAVRGLNK